MAVQRKKVLVIEDDQILIDALSLQLSRSGFLVEKSMDGLNINELTAHFLPDIILLDVLLPKIKGTTILRQIKNDDRLDHIPIIMLSNLNPSPSLIEEIKGIEPTFYMVKSDCSLADIVEKTREALRMD